MLSRMSALFLVVLSVLPFTASLSTPDAGRALWQTKQQKRTEWPKTALGHVAGSPAIPIIRAIGRTKFVRSEVRGPGGADALPPLDVRPSSISPAYGSSSFLLPLRI
jgi:hypothetical protein